MNKKDEILTKIGDQCVADVKNVKYKTSIILSACTYIVMKFFKNEKNFIFLKRIGKIHKIKHIIMCERYMLIC